ncbi:MAG: hypothetical protein NW701_12380 [Nitrospira sp.]
MSEYYKKPGDVRTILTALQQKFAGNFSEALSKKSDGLRLAELKARALSEIGKMVCGHKDLTSSQIECVCIFDEIFGDIICSIYFAACALDKPAQLLLRRTLELGVAIIYLWDLPHRFWAWKNHDDDLNFSEMLEHLSSEGYKTHVHKANPKFLSANMCDVRAARKLYRELSNIVHGKMSSFESTSPDRFNFTESDWSRHLILTNAVEDLLLDLWQNRFQGTREQLPKAIPQLFSQT